MSEPVTISIIQHFSELEDPRADDERKKHELLDIVVMAILGVICGAEDWVNISEFGKAKEDWFRQFLKLPNGVPSHDTFRRVFSLLSPEKFVGVFSKWVSALSEATDGEIVAIDGKTLRGSFDRASDKAALHVVNAWSCANGLVLGQVEVDGKSNEITAIPKLVEILELSGCTVTIDAMGCQKDIAEQIRDEGADYVLALKGNHGDLYEDVKLYFESHKSNDFADFKGEKHETVDGAHGRIETRRYYLETDIEWSGADAVWKDLAGFGMVEATREVNGKVSTETRYYLTSLTGSAEELARAVRSHWQVENSMHWVLDVAFREDDCRTRDRRAAQNFSLLRKIALNLLKNDKSVNVGVKGQRLRAGWDNQYLLSVLGA